jgi:hypothetical protein
VQKSRGLSQRLKAAAKVQRRSAQLRLIQLRACKGNNARAEMWDSSQGVGREELLSLPESESVQSEGGTVGGEDDGRELEDLTGGRLV